MVAALFDVVLAVFGRKKTIRINKICIYWWIRLGISGFTLGIGFSDANRSRRFHF